MNRKPTKNTRGPNAAEKRHADWVKNKGYCSACLAEAPLILHHCMGATYRHNKELIGHWFVLGLCQHCDDLVTKGSRKRLTEHFKQSQGSMWVQQVVDYQHSTGNHDCPLGVAFSILDCGQ